MTMPYLAIINMAGYLPDTEPAEFEYAREAWEYLLTERNEVENEWFDPDIDEPKYSATSDQIHQMFEAAAWERMAKADWDGTGVVTGPDASNPDVTIVYEVRLAEGAQP